MNTFCEDELNTIRYRLENASFNGLFQKEASGLFCQGGRDRVEDFKPFGREDHPFKSERKFPFFLKGNIASLP